MTIERFHFEGGLEVNAFLPAGSTIETLIKTYRDQGEVLQPGEYDLTPDERYKPPSSEGITVFENGTGLYHTRGQSLHLPRVLKHAAVMTRNERSGAIQIHDIVRFTS